MQREEHNSKEMISAAMDLTLGCLGYDKHHIKERQYFAYKWSFALADSTKRILRNSDTEKIVVGSKRDGTGMEYTSDTDILQINHGVICVENVNDVPNDKLVAFKLDYTSTKSGYARLILINKGTNERFSKLKYAVLSRNGKNYLSSDKFMARNDDVHLKSTGFLGKNTRYFPRDGPSCPKIVNETYLERIAMSCNGNDLPKQKIDFVRAFPCKGKSFLKSWSKAIKGYQWPPRKLKDAILTLPMHVVPVGHKSSRNKGNEWRVSFTMAEHELLLSFNNTQMKLLVLLKIIAKHYLEVISKSMTSYVMKHVIFWIVATHPEDEFIPENLYKLTEISLNFLKSSINAGKHFHFIVARRNLFEQKITGKEKTELLKRINFLLENGQGTISRLLWDQNESNAAKVFHEELRKMATAFVFDKARNCSFALVTYQELSDHITNSFNASHFRRIVQLFDCKKLYALFKFMVKKRGVEFLKVNLLNDEIIGLLQQIKEYQRKNTFYAVKTNFVKSKKKLNVDKQQEERKCARSYGYYKSKVEYFAPDMLIANWTMIICVIGIISTCIYDALIFDMSTFLLFMNCVTVISLTYFLYIEFKYKGNICKRCGKQKRDRMLLTVYTTEGTYQITLWSRSLIHLSIKFSIVLSIGIFSFIVYDIGCIAKGFSLPMLVKVIICTMTENCTIINSR